jgi:Zn-dependent protease
VKLEASLGRMAGVDIRVHASFALIAALIVASLASHFGGTHPAWHPAAVWATAVLTAALFFFTLVLHELSHAMVARSRGIPVRSITLFALGGVARIEHEAADPSTEFWMGIVGPITSTVIGAGCLALAAASGWSPSLPPETPGASVLVWLGVINLSLAAFNMLPGFPLDGGRVLRALLWWVQGDAVKAARWAARAGQAVAVGLIFIGLLESFAGAGLNALWLVFVGWFLLGAAGSSARHPAASDQLQGLRVADVMSRDCAQVEAGISLREFVIGHLMRTGRRCFLVTQGDRVVGLLTPEALKDTDRSRWAQTPVRAVMRPLEELTVVSPDSAASDWLVPMSAGGVPPLAVVQDGRLQGVLSRGDILRVLRSRAELQM